MLSLFRSPETEVRMKEPFADEKLYDEDAQSFGPVEIRNYREVLRGYNYTRYETRFRALANRQSLSPHQRPKLTETQFASLIEDLTDRLLRPREEDPLANPKNQQTAQRLLLANDFEEDWG
jgi:hypothetical protein